MTDEKKKIIVIDDDKIQLTIAENILKDEYTVFTATSGKEAIEYLLKGIIPNLILLDILMPKMDGWETFRRIRSISLLRDIPIIFLTSVTEESKEKKAYEVGAADYIKKPYEKEDLLNRIKAKIKV